MKQSQNTTHYHVKPATLHNARKIAEYYPHQVSVPTWEALATIQAGNCVKVGAGDMSGPCEGFWVEILSLYPPLMIGKIVNHLQLSTIHGLKALDVITVHLENIFEIIE